MRKILVLAAVLAVAVPAVAGEGGHMKSESGWFDMENCAFCKNLLEDPGLLPHTTWENHAIDGGMMTILTVDPAYAESAAKASAAMEALGTKMATGQVDPASLTTCGHCQEFGAIMMSGVGMEIIKGKAAEVSLFTSDDPALVERMHAMVKRDNEEMALMMAGHDHGHGDHDHSHNH